MNVTTSFTTRGRTQQDNQMSRKGSFFKKEGTLLQKKKKTIFIRSSGKDVPDWFDPLNQTFIK